jgi:hypothetical protein
LPNQAGTHHDVPIIERLLDLSIDQIRTPFCRPLAGAAVFQVIVTSLPSSPTLRRKIYSRLTPTTIKLAAALGC